MINMHRKQLVIFILMKFLAVSKLQETTDFNCGPNTVEVPPCVEACPPTCAVPYRQFCPAICIVSGCVCKEGFIRTENRNSPCIPISECPRNETKPVKCGRNEVPVDCFTTCEPACNRRGPRRCPPITCETTGCLCAEGYIRRDWLEENSPCIPESKCPCTANDKTVETADTV